MVFFGASVRVLFACSADVGVERTTAVMGTQIMHTHAQLMLDRKVLNNVAHIGTPKACQTHSSNIQIVYNYHQLFRGSVFLVAFKILQTLYFHGLLASYAILSDFTFASRLAGHKTGTQSAQLIRPFQGLKQGEVHALLARALPGTRLWRP